jgi:CheY-like chemotaxis protein
VPDRLLVSATRLPEEALERIFDEYFQFDNPARNIKKGLGLGLAIVKRLAHLLNPPINVRSALGEGSIFSVDIPLAEQPAVTANPAGSSIPVHGERQLAVLFIDDDSAVADSLFILAAAGFDAASAGDGNEAIARLEDGLRPHVVFSDYRMPNEDGLEAVPRVRQTLGGETPAIVMTRDTSLCHIEAQNIANSKLFKSLSILMH